MPAGVIAYPLTFLAADVLTEVYGIQAARRTIWLGFASAGAMVVLLLVAVALPDSPVGAPQAAFARVLGQAPRIVLGSFVAYLASEFTNAQVMATMRRLSGGRALWARTIGSTVVGQALDTVIFISIAFAAVPALGVTGVPLSQVVVIIVSQYAVKVLVEVVGTPPRVRRGGRAEATGRAGAGAILASPVAAND